MEPPIFAEALKPIRASDGEEVIFTCKVQGNPMPTVEWFYGEQNLSGREEYAVTFDPMSGLTELLIPECFPEDAGIFKCIAANPVGEATSAAELVVSVPSLEAVMEVEVAAEEDVQPMEVKESETVPQPDTRERPPPPDDDSLDEDTSPPESYTMVAETEEAPAESEDAAVTEDVIEPTKQDRPPVATEEEDTVPVEISSEIVLPPDDDKEPSPEDLPEVTVMETTEEMETEEAEITEEIIQIVPAGDQPEETVPQPEEPKAEVTSEAPEEVQAEVVFTATLPQEQMEISEKETRTNTETVETKQKVVTTKTEEEGVPAQFSQPIKPQVVHETEVATFTATVIGTPRPEITWYKDHVLLELGGRFKMLQPQDSSEVSLVIENACNEDFGNYTCEAKNPGGRARCTANLVVVRKYGDSQHSKIMDLIG